MNWIKIADLALRYAPAVISTVERLFAGKPGVEKRAAAAKETFELIKEFVDQDIASDFSELAEMDAAALLRAGRDEERFVEEVAKVNDALVAFTNFVNTYRVA